MIAELLLPCKKGYFCRKLCQFLIQTQSNMKKQLIYLTAVLAFIFSAITTTNAQIRTPQPSPGAKLTQTVGLTEITVEYSRPSLKDREAFGEGGIVQYGSTWRTGANSATKITFSDDVKIGGSMLTKGAYAILTIPGENDWVVMFFPYEKTDWSSYEGKTPAAKISSKVQKTSHTVESLTFDINNLRNTSASLDFYWDHTMLSLPIEVEVDKKVMADIERIMAGPSGNDYYAAATYYHESGKDLKKALEYIQKATAGDDPKFWQVRREALILGDLKMYAEAVAAAEKSSMLAEKAGNKEYVTMNAASIETWKPMIKKSGKK